MSYFFILFEKYRSIFLGWEWDDDILVISEINLPEVWYFLNREIICNVLLVSIMLILIIEYVTCRIYI